MPYMATYNNIARSYTGYYVTVYRKIDLRAVNINFDYEYFYRLHLKLFLSK